MTDFRIPQKHGGGKLFFLNYELMLVYIKDIIKEVNTMQKDPVCNMNVDEKKAAATSEYKGKTYYFCAKVCKERFDREPEKYLTKEKK